MPIDTGARRKGRAVSRIGPTVGGPGHVQSPQATALQGRARTSTLASLATGRGPSAQRASSRLATRTQNISHAQALLRRVLGANHYPGLDHSQAAVLNAVLGQGVRSHADRQSLLSAVETGLVESNLANLGGGDADSAGWRQERASIYANPTNLKASAGRYFSETKAAGPHPTAGQLAADVQRPAEQYRGRYDEVASEAKPLLRQFLRGRINPQTAARARATLRSAGVKPGRPTSPAPAAGAQLDPAQRNRFQAIKKSANQIAGTPYVLGGGHGGYEAHPSTLDCSGAVSHVLIDAGVLKSPLTSGQMGQVLKPGPGAVTVYYNAGHTFMKIGDRYWGTSVGDSGSGGLGPHPTPSSSYLAQYSVGHVPGLGKKAAIGLGVKLAAGGGSAPSGGGSSTADFTSGVIKTTPGFSNHPIKALSPKQKLGRLDRILGTADTASSGIGSLSREHGSPVV